MLGALFLGHGNRRGNGGETPRVRGLSGLLLSGRGWRQPSPPPALRSSHSKGQVLGAAFFTVRAA